MKITRKNIKSILARTVGTTMLAGALLMAPQAAQARVFVSVGIAPPAIPVYAQPDCPGDGYIWTPGYWAYTDDGYQWVEGAWVLAPYTGALWTPGYWGYNDGAYLWNAGYWGTSIGYYGGINYGFGYFGVGFYGGYWNHGAFFYNRDYNHFGGGFRGGDHFYSQHYGNFDGRPGGSSFARGGFEGNRGDTFNNATNRGGFGQAGNQNGFHNNVYPPNGNRIVGTVNRGTSFNGGNVNGGFAQNTGRVNIASAAPNGGGSFNHGVQPGNSFQGNRGTQAAPTRQPGNFQGNAGRPSGGNEHAPSAPTNAGHISAASGSHGGGPHGGRR